MVDLGGLGLNSVHLDKVWRIASGAIAWKREEYKQGGHSKDGGWGGGGMTAHKAKVGGVAEVGAEMGGSCTWGITHWVVLASLCMQSAANG